jgi:hypothetical protein
VGQRCQRPRREGGADRSDPVPGDAGADRWARTQGARRAKRYPAISVVRSRSDEEDQSREGWLAAGGAAPLRGGEIAGVGASAFYCGSGVAGAG